MSVLGHQPLHGVRHPQGGLHLQDDPEPQALLNYLGLEYQDLRGVFQLSDREPGFLAPSS